MSNEARVRCEGITRAGTRCKNSARPGERFCHVHRQNSGHASEQAADRLQQLVRELDDLVADLKSSIPEPSSSPVESLQPEKLVQFFKDNLDKVTPDVAKGIAASFQGATIEDLMDPDTWKGMGYMLNYSMRFQLEQLKQRLLGEDGDAE